MSADVVQTVVISVSVGFGTGLGSEIAKVLVQKIKTKEVK